MINVWSGLIGAGAGLFFIFQRRFLRQLVVGLSLMFFQQVTGQPSVLYYATKMFEMAGLRMGAEASGIAGVLGAFKLAMTCKQTRVMITCDYQIHVIR